MGWNSLHPVIGAFDSIDRAFDSLTSTLISLNPPQSLKKCYQCTRAGKGCTYTGQNNKNTTPHPLLGSSNQSEKLSNQAFESEEEEGLTASPIPLPSKQIKYWKQCEVEEESEGGEEVEEEVEEKASKGLEDQAVRKERIKAALIKMGQAFMELVGGLL